MVMPILPLVATIGLKVADARWRRDVPHPWDPSLAPKAKKSARGDRRSRLSRCLICYCQVRFELHIHSHFSFSRRQALISSAHFETHQHLEQTSTIF